MDVLFNRRIHQVADGIGIQRRSHRLDDCVGDDRWRHDYYWWRRNDVYRFNNRLGLGLGSSLAWLLLYWFLF